jgi:D-arabinose 1-dehydrogenase-like Zn-dependent alcohol dehydrogenase
VHAIDVAEIGGPDVLTFVEKPLPAPGPGEVVIKAEAIGVNFVDTYFRSGLYPHDLPFVLGAEVAGTVARVGEGVTAMRVGDRVASADAVGAYAEYCVAPADLVAPVPDGVGCDVAAAAILKGMTAHLLIKSVFPVHPGDAVLLHAGAGGVGLILTQWATSLGARVITTTSTAQKAQRSRQAGGWRRSAIPTTRSSSAPRSAHSPTATVPSPSTTALVNQPLRPAWPASQFGARWRCTVQLADRCHRWTHSGSTPPARCISPVRLALTLSARGTSSPGGQANYSMRSPLGPSR